MFSENFDVSFEIIYEILNINYIAHAEKFKNFQIKKKTLCDFIANTFKQLNSDVYYYQPGINSLIKILLSFEDNFMIVNCPRKIFFIIAFCFFIDIVIKNRKILLFEKNLALYQNSLYFKTLMNYRTVNLAISKIISYCIKDFVSKEKIEHILVLQMLIDVSLMSIINKFHRTFFDLELMLFKHYEKFFFLLVIIFDTNFNFEKFYKFEKSMSGDIIIGFNFCLTSRNEFYKFLMLKSNNEHITSFCQTILEQHKNFNDVFDIYVDVNKIFTKEDFMYFQIPFIIKFKNYQIFKKYSEHNSFLQFLYKTIYILQNNVLKIKNFIYNVSYPRRQ